LRTPFSNTPIEESRRIMSLMLSTGIDPDGMLGGKDNRSYANVVRDLPELGAILQSFRNRRSIESVLRSIPPLKAISFGK
jgi:hypothetical protein